MDDIDLDWMTEPVRRIFTDGVRLFAEAVRDGAVLHMQDGLEAMQRAEQLHLRGADARSGADDPSI